jgi:hypothetical protein
MQQEYTKAVKIVNFLRIACLQMYVMLGLHTYFSSEYAACPRIFLVYWKSGPSLRLSLTVIFFLKYFPIYAGKLFQGGIRYICGPNQKQDRMRKSSNAHVVCPVFFGGVGGFKLNL